RAPRTYTTEDIIEINCHGSTFGARKILELLIKNGASYAQAGEFTKRAFLNGRIDLAKAEAVIDIINSKTNIAHTTGVNQLGGALSEKINGIRNNLLKCISNLQAALDFPEEGLEPLSDEQYFEILEDAKKDIEILIKTADKGKIIRDGINTVIVGKPNVGKSSLLNLLSGEERAIVTEIEGTTRDAIEEYVNIGDITLKITDTAGIRQTGDTVENMGVEKSRKLVSEASLVIFMLDATKEVDENDLEIKELIKDKTTIVLINKSEEKVNESVRKIAENFENVIEFSVKKEKGVDEFSNLIKKLFDMGNLDDISSGAVINIRHKEALFAASKSVKSAIDAINMGLPVDMTSVDIENAIASLGTVTGLTIGEEVVDRIFHEFCVGK
ncbi:MAG: tRNA uridine-5-carboxymethylaminomethyl(34) synthesis GTPase MnmE, partial [Ruminococcaceae bacterium]|nr:tRNA uridine-5-carboxymethylaminomethyl(34) synthesis GTPase MnmE [Oscillospiraceae bacterium]